MLKVTSSIYTSIYFGFDTLKTMQYFSWGEQSTHFFAPCMNFFFSFFLVATFQFSKKKKKNLNLNIVEL